MYTYLCDVSTEWKQVLGGKRMQRACKHCIRKTLVVPLPSCNHTPWVVSGLTYFPSPWCPLWNHGVIWWDSAVAHNFKVTTYQFCFCANIFSVIWWCNATCCNTAPPLRQLSLMIKWHLYVSLETTSPFNMKNLFQNKLSQFH